VKKIHVFSGNVVAKKIPKEVIANNLQNEVKAESKK
jgi:hypothetical protein